ncbi:hypothetical protein [Vreelandella zhuhanensis]|uniref:hypothetical protein n=1 Tax=Vreelandella zhuhanensis TaxID=2684210 RepID=UPI001D1115BA|nr:hypothetical protein [Halomonas zhuhanensis]
MSDIATRGDFQPLAFDGEGQADSVRQGWQSGDRKRRDAKPPRFNPVAGCYPVMYRGQLAKFDDGFTTASLKLWDSNEWLWHDVAIKAVRQRHFLGTVKSPTLVINRRCHLAVQINAPHDSWVHSLGRYR